MKKIILIALGLILLFTIIFMALDLFFSKKIAIKDEPFKVEMAVTDAERMRGLSGRKSLCQKCSMLFIFEKPGNYSFWMKDMLFPLDIIWILDDRIVHIAKDVSPEFKGSIRPENIADKVLEINADLSDKYGLEIGDEVKF